jgi:cytochrome P450
VADLAASFAERIPVAVVCEMLGVPESDHVQLLQWTHDIANALRPTVSDEVIERADRATDHFWEYFRALVKAKERHPADDLLSDMIEVRDGTDRLNDDELCGLAMQLLRAGSETTISVIAGGLYSLLTNPEQAELMRACTECRSTAVEELLRYESPIQLDFTRVVLADFELQGSRLAEGDHVVPMLAAANRDPRRFPVPDQLQVDRTGVTQLAFGKGLHFCLGAPLARLEIGVAVGTVLRRFPDAVVARPPQRRGGPMVRSVQSLPVMLRPR